MSKKKGAKPTHMVADGRTWKRVKTPRPWRPKVVGDTLVGTYLGLHDKNGQFGPYQVVLIKCADGEVRYVSGTVIISLFTAAGFNIGELPQIRLVWQGLQDGTMGNTYKDFDLYVADEAEPRVSRSRPVKTTK